MTRLLKNNRAFAFLLATICFGCHPASENAKESTPFVLRGNLRNATAQRIFLGALEDEGFVAVDTAAINARGQFQFRGKFTSPRIVRVSLSPANGLWVVIDSSLIEVQADAKDLHGSYEVRGSKESKLLKTLMDGERQYARTVADIEKRFVSAQKAGKSDSVFYYQEKYLNLVTAFGEQKKNFIRRHPDSFVATYAAYAMIGEEEDEFLDSMLVVFNRRISGSRYVKLLNERRGRAGAISVGAIAPEIDLPRPDGSPFRLSALRGKYVLVDFWASWCKPCRQENPNVVRLYKRFREKGFEILGVSLDDSKDRWIEAIQEDGLPWQHVSDLKGLNSAAIQSYGVEAIPMTVLLDEEGRVIALNLRGRALEEELEKLFGA